MQSSSTSIPHHAHKGICRCWKLKLRGNQWEWKREKKGKKKLFYQQMVKTFIPVCLSFMGFLVFPKAQEHINSSEELCLCKYHGIGRRRESTWASNNIRNLYNPLVCQKALPDEVFITKPSFYLRCFYSRYHSMKTNSFRSVWFLQNVFCPKEGKTFIAVRGKSLTWKNILDVVQLFFASSLFA